MHREFLRLSCLEPRLSVLYLEAALTDAGPDFCAIDAWGGRGGFKLRMERLVGYCREEPGPEELFDSEAYRVAYDVILAALPPCRGRCACGESRAAS